MTTGSSSKDTFVHLFAGGVAGTAGAIVTCPLEVVKTRLQSSTNTLLLPKIASTNGDDGRVTCKTISPDQRRHISTLNPRLSTHMLTFSQSYASRSSNSMSLIRALKNIIEHEGPKALFRGLGPNLVGVAPSRAIYFCTYSKTKNSLTSHLSSETPFIHIISASLAGFASSSLTNPIWFVKTRLQLDNKKNGQKLSTFECIKQIYNKSGILGFYKGITASYMGISETVIHFVIYEAIKAHLVAKRMQRLGLDESLVENAPRETRDFVEFMIAAAISKTIASSAAYPHEVARTRLREEGSKYRSFWQTLGVVYQEEGHRGLYRGLSIQLLRQIPNTAIMMATYEAVVYVLTRNKDGTMKSGFTKSGT